MPAMTRPATSPPGSRSRGALLARRRLGRRRGGWRRRVPIPAAAPDPVADRTRAAAPSQPGRRRRVHRRWRGGAGGVRSRSRWGAGGEPGGGGEPGAGGGSTRCRHGLACPALAGAGSAAPKTCCGAVLDSPAAHSGRSRSACWHGTAFLARLWDHGGSRTRPMRRVLQMSDHRRRVGVLATGAVSMALLCQPACRRRTGRRCHDSTQP